METATVVFIVGAALFPVTVCLMLICCAIAVRIRFGINDEGWRMNSFRTPQIFRIFSEAPSAIQTPECLETHL